MSTEIRRAVDVSPHLQVRVTIHEDGTKVAVHLWRRDPHAKTLSQTAAGFVLPRSAARKLGTLLVHMAS